MKRGQVEGNRGGVYHSSTSYNVKHHKEAVNQTNVTKL